MCLKSMRRSVPFSRRSMLGRREMAIMTMAGRAKKSWLSGVAAGLMRCSSCSDCVRKDWG